MKQYRTNVDIENCNISLALYNDIFHCMQNSANQIYVNHFYLQYKCFM